MRHVYVEETYWPVDLPTDPDTNTVEWTLRYGNPTRQQLLFAASILSGYKALAMDPDPRARLSRLRKAHRQ